MPFSVAPCQPADCDRLFHIISDTFQHIQPIVDAFFPKHDTPAGHIHGVKLLCDQQSDPNVHFVKAVDEERGEIVGVAKWLILHEEVKVGEIGDEGGLRESEEERAYVKELLTQYYSSRSEALREVGSKILVLDLLAVDPKWQGCGAGSMLVKWGLDFADEMGFRQTFVESTVSGRAVYEKCGFQVVKRMKFELKEKFPDGREPHLFFMRRDAEQESS